MHSNGYHLFLFLPFEVINRQLINAQRIMQNAKKPDAAMASGLEDRYQAWAVCGRDRSRPYIDLELSLDNLLDGTCSAISASLNEVNSVDQVANVEHSVIVIGSEMVDELAVNRVDVHFLEDVASAHVDDIASERDGDG